MGRTCYSYGRTEPNKTGTRCCGRRKKTKGQTKTKMGRWCDGRCQEAGGEKLEECCQEQGQLAEASEEGLGSKGAVVPMMMMMKNDLPNAISGMSTLILFAGDTSLIVSSPDRLQLEKDSNAVMQSLSKWFHSNLLSLNCKKTHFLQFLTKTQILQKLT